MATDLIELARQKKAAAEESLQNLQAEVERVRQDLAGWQEFIDRAEALASSPSPNGRKSTEGTKAPAAGGKKEGKVKVKKGSLVGHAAAMILAKGPQALRDIAAHLREKGLGGGAKDFPTALNTALWRRREDLFERKDGLYRLKTEEIEFVE
jgi:hypothetical protein